MRMPDRKKLPVTSKNYKERFQKSPNIKSKSQRKCYLVFFLFKAVKYSFEAFCVQLQRDK